MMKRLASLARALLLLPGLCLAQSSDDPNLALPNAIVTVARDGYSIAGLATHLDGPKTFAHGVALFPGSEGVIRLREENGRILHDQVGNFLIRSRRQWLDESTLTLVVDAPSDRWPFFNEQLRAAPRYGEDLHALLAEVTRRYGVEDWTLVGTSLGTVTAFQGARMNPAIVKRLILTSSALLPTRNGPGLSSVDWRELKVPLLWVHHVDDSCPPTPYREARRAAESSMSPLVTVRGGGPFRGDRCGPYFPHGYFGLEREVVQAMRAWIRSGQVPADIVESRH